MLLLVSICIPETVTSTPGFPAAVNCSKAHEYVEVIFFVQVMSVQKYEKCMWRVPSVSVRYEVVAPVCGLRNHRVAAVCGLWFFRMCRSGGGNYAFSAAGSGGGGVC